MNIFGYGGRPQGRWDNQSSNRWQVGGQTLEEYIDAQRKAGNTEDSDGKLRSQFWQQRNAAVEATRLELEGMNPSSSIDMILANTFTQDATAVMQVQNAADQWRKLDEITSGKIIGGTVLGYDIETFGDTAFGNRGEFGITEFGIGTTTFKEHGLFNQKGHALAIGLSDSQFQYVSDVLSKYKANGWSALSNSEQVTMQRMSMYAGSGDKANFRSVFRQITEEGDFKGLWEVKPDALLKSDMSIERIQRGISNLRTVYKEGAVDSVVIPKAMNYLQDAYSNNGILTAANSSFDITTLARYTDGQYGDFIKTMKDNTVDLIYGIRTAAAARGISVSKYQELIHGNRGGGAAVQSILLSLGLNETETHLSISDINQQIRLLAARDFAKGKTLGQDLTQFFKADKNGKTAIVNEKGKEIVKRYDAKNTVFLLNRGWLDKRNGKDITLIDTGNGIEATQNYTITGEYWELDETHTSPVEDGYRLSMRSTADGTIISKYFENEDRAVDFLRNNSDWYERDEVTNIENQIRYKYQDRGRRAFEKALDPASVAVEDYDKPANGFARMEEFLEWNEKYGSRYSTNQEGFHQFIADMSKSPDGFNINTANTMQEFIGAQAKISEERALLEFIRDKVNETYGETTVQNNMQKTIAFRKAYEDAMVMMESKGEIQLSDEYQNLIMNDTYGIDIKMPDGRISRINTHTTSTATRDVNRIFSQMTKGEAVAAIDDLVSRQIINKGQGEEFARLLREVGVDSGKDAASRIAVEKYLNTESTYQVYTDIAYALSNRANTGQGARINESLSARMQDYMHRRYITNEGVKSVNDLWTDSNFFTEQDKSLIQKSIKQVPFISMHEDTSKSEFLRQLNSLTQSLGYGDDIIKTFTDDRGVTHEYNIVNEMFFKEGKDYSVESRSGVHSIIVRPDENGSAFALFTNNSNYGHLMEELSKVQAADIATYQSITGSSLSQYATIYELPSIQRYTVGQHTDDVKNYMDKSLAEMVVLKQSENSEKFLIPKLSVFDYGEGDRSNIHAYINNGVYDYLSSWRMRGKLALDKIEAGQFEDATQYLRRQQNEKIKNLSSSASYRGYWTVDPETGKPRIERRKNYTPADYMAARQTEMIEGLHSIFKYGLSEDEGVRRNDLDTLVDAYGETFGVYKNKRETVKHYRERIADSVYFKEFFNKNLFLSTLADDSVVGGIQGVRDKNIFSLIQETVNRDSAGIFNDSVREALNTIAPIVKEGNIYQVISGSAIEHGRVSLGVPTGDYNVNAFLYSTMRPTYSQQNLGRLFNPDEEWNDADFSDDILRTFAGSPEITIRDYEGLTNIGKVIDGYDKQVRHVMTGFKQMNDYDLQRKYAFMKERAGVIADKLGVSIDTYEKALEYMRLDMLSLNEGKWFMDPRMAQQQIVKQADAKKVKLLDLKRADAQSSGEALQVLIDNNALITANTIVGYDNSGEALYAGSDFRARLDMFNMEDIFDIKVVDEVEIIDGVETITKKNKYSFKSGATGFTRVIPDIADINDIKLMFNGSEKATAHAIAIDSFLNYMSGTEIIDEGQAVKLLSGMFQEISDGATLIGNMSLEKHGNLFALDSPWRIITSEYVARGQGQSLVNYLNTQIANGAEAYKEIKSFKLIDGRIVSDSGKAANPAKFLLSITNDIMNNVNGNTETNTAIRNIIEYTRKNNISYGAIEFMNQNEHVSDGISWDERIRQGIRQRAYAAKNGEQWGLEYTNWLYDSAKNYTGKRDGGTQYDNLRQIFDFANKSINIGKIQNRNKRYNMEKSLHGIVESLIYYEDPNAFDINSKNILKLDFQQLMNTNIIPQNGASVSTLQSSLFFTDGKPSEALQKLAAEQSVNFGPMRSSYSNSLYIDLGSYSIKSKDGRFDLNGFLIPIQNVITDADETMFQQQQRLTARMLSEVQALIENPGNRSTAQINYNINKVVREYYANSMRQLAVADKDSDYYRAMHRVLIPNSGGMLAEQEVAPLIYDEKSNAKMQALLQERDELEYKISYRPHGVDADSADIKRLDGIYDEIKAINLDVAKRISEGEVLNFTQLKGTALEGIEKEIVRINGSDKAVYSYVAATSKQTFKDQGLDFAQFGMDIIADLEKKGDMIPEEFLKTARYHRAQIVQKLNDAGIEGLTIENEKTMMQELNEWSKKYGTSIAEFNAKGFNEAIADGGPLNRVGQIFEGVAEDYLRQVGIVGELIRYPTFRTQFASRFILSDHIKGNQVVMYNPVASSITNVDFDGDLMYSIFNFMYSIFDSNDASGLLAKNKVQLQRQVQRQAYESSISYIPDLLAELVKEGEAYNKDDVNNATKQMAAILKKMNRKEYDSVRESYIQKHHLGEMTKAQGLAFHTSQEIRDAFLGFEYNTVYNVASQKASLASVLRKGNIGHISTTNFNARTMIEEMASYYDKIGNTEAYEKTMSILESVTNPKSAKGGLFDVAEQSGIDTKHVWDAMTTAETARYSMGMNLLFGKFAMPRKGESLESQQRVAVEHIVSSLYANVFKQTNNDSDINKQQNIRKIVDEIMSHKNDWQTYDFGGVDIMPKRGIAALLAMQELDMPNNLTNLRRLFASSFNKGYDSSFGDSVYMLEEVSDLMEIYQEMNKTNAEIIPGFYQSETYFKGLSEFIVGHISDSSLQANKNTSYVLSSSLRGQVDTKLLNEDLFFNFKESWYTKNKAVASFDVYRYNRNNNKITKVDAYEYADVIPKVSGMRFKDGSITFSASSNEALNKALFSSDGFFKDALKVASVVKIKNDMNVAYEAISTLNKFKITRGINDIVINPTGTIASPQTIQNNIQFLRNLGDKEQVNFGKQEYDIIKGLFVQPGVDIRTVSTRTSELIKTYEYARSTGQIHSNIPVNDLLTSINNDIASHPERYKAQPDNTFTQTFDKIFEQRLLSNQIFATTEYLESVRQSMIQLGDFDVESYNKVVQELRSSIYDVQSEEKALSNRYNKLIASNPYGQTQVVQEAQATLENTLEKFKADVHALNQEHIESAQKQIYGMFKSKQQMDSFFGWTGNISTSAQKVGFGMHIGQSFDSLTASEAFNIISSAKPIIENKALSDEVRHAAEETSVRLSDYMRDVGISNTRSSIQYNKETSKVLEESMKKVDKLQENAKIEVTTVSDAAEELLDKSGLADTTAEAAKDTANKSTHKKTLTGQVIGKFKDFAKENNITSRHVGIAVAGMAALGVANNLLHNQKTDSPLSPARKPNGKGSPSIDGYYPDSPEEARTPPASTGKKVVYQTGGLNFRVSAGTTRNNNAREQAAQISSVTGGSTNISVQQDTSRVTDNWLSNKFADLL